MTPLILIIVPMLKVTLYLPPPRYTCHRSCAAKVPPSCGLPRELKRYAQMQVTQSQHLLPRDNYVTSTAPSPPMSLLPLIKVAFTDESGDESYHYDGYTSDSSEKGSTGDISGLSASSARRPGPQIIMANSLPNLLGLSDESYDSHVHNSQGEFEVTNLVVVLNFAFYYISSFNKVCVMKRNRNF